MVAYGEDVSKLLIGSGRILHSEASDMVNHQLEIFVSKFVHFWVPRTLSSGRIGALNSYVIWILGSRTSGLMGTRNHWCPWLWCYMYAIVWSQSSYRTTEWGLPIFERFCPRWESVPVSFQIFILVFYEDEQISFKEVEGIRQSNLH